MFRHVESTVVKDMLNRQCEQFSACGDQCSIFRENYMASNKCHLIGGVSFYRSLSAVSSCGALRAGDVVWLLTNMVGRVAAFWSHDKESIVAQLDMFVATDDSKVWDVYETSFAVVDIAEIVDAVIWVSLSPTQVRVVQPYIG